MALSKFIELFAGRTDAYGSWEGGCVKQPVTHDLYMAHLLGDVGMGVYPVNEHNTTRWGCSDVDVPDLDSVHNLRTALLVKNITSWIERTRRGYHLWIFAREPIPAATMRRCLLAAHQVCEYPAKEVNPKQEVITNGYGNYVRLPYFGGWENQPTERIVLDDRDMPMTLQNFVEAAHNTRVSLDLIEHVAEKWTPPAPQPAMIRSGKPMSLGELRYMISPYSYTIMANGPLEGSDRSSTLVRLAYRLRTDGLMPAEALTVLIEADKKWGKFHDREDGVMHLESIVMKVYQP
jgi:hypothetical protein